MINYLRGLGAALTGKAATVNSPLPALMDVELYNLWGKQVGAQYTDAEFYQACVAVYSCTRLRANNIATPPLVVYQKRDGELQAVDENHPVQQLLNKVNPWWTRGQLWRATETSLCLQGSAFWAIYKNLGGKPAEIWWLRPDRMRVIPGGKKYIDRYEYLGLGGNVIKYAPEDIIWLKYFNPLDEFAGLSPIEAARISIEANQDALKWNRNFFKNDATPGRVYIKTDQNLTKEQSDMMREEWRAKFKGVSRAHGISVFGAGADLKALGINQRDMEFIAGQRYTLEDVCRTLGVPPLLVADLEKATYSNVREAKTLLWYDTLLPELTWIAEEINEMLLPRFGDSSLYVAFDTTNIQALQEDANTRADRDVKHITSGTKTINEVRDEQNLEPVPWGDSWWIPLTMFPAGEAQPQAAALPEAAPVGKALMTKAIEYEQAELLELEIFGKRLGRFEPKFQTALKQHFAEQEKAVIAKLVGKKQQDPLGLFDEDFWTTVLRKLGLPYLTAMLAETGATEAGKLAIKFDLLNPLVQHWLGQRTAKFSKYVTEETASALTQQLRAAELAGESIPQIQARIEEVFKFNSDVRSERIARTEMVGSSNRGALEAYRQSGVVDSKRWLASLDERTRPAHAEAHRQTVALDAPFMVGGEEIDGPGDGSPENSINCRCTVQPVIETRKALSAGNGQRIRCPKCSNVLAESLNGEASWTCDRCHDKVTIANGKRDGQEPAGEHKRGAQ